MEKSPQNARIFTKAPKDKKHKKRLLLLTESGFRILRSSGWVSRFWIRDAGRNTRRTQKLRKKGTSATSSRRKSCFALCAVDVMRMLCERALVEKLYHKVFRLFHQRRRGGVIERGINETVLRAKETSRLLCEISRLISARNINYVTWAHAHFTQILI